MMLNNLQINQNNFQMVKKNVQNTIWNVEKKKCSETF